MRAAISDRRLESVAGVQGLTLRPPTNDMVCPPDGFTVCSYTTGATSWSGLFAPDWENHTWAAWIWQGGWTVGQLSAFRMDSSGMQTWNQIGKPSFTTKLDPSAWVPGADLVIEGNAKVIAMWDRPLTDTEIARLFTSTVPTY